jgi:putative hemolysin
LDNAASSVAVEVVFILILIIANGVFSMSETAIVSARKARLQQRANEGDKRAQRALDLANEPASALATVQIGITLIGILAGAFGGATIAEQLGRSIATIPALAPYADALSLGIVVLIITYLSLIVGELVPKSLALNNPERIAAVAARPMRTLTRILYPAVTILNVSTNFILRLLGIRASDEPAVTEDEIKVMLAQGTQTGTFAEAEEHMIRHVFRFADLRVAAMMTPRTEITWLDLADPADVIRHKIAKSHFALYPVTQNSLDNVIGVVRAKDLLVHCLAHPDHLDIQVVMQKPLFVPESMSALRLLETLRKTGVSAAIVVDEYGGVQGLVTMNTVVEEIVGDVVVPGSPEQADVVRREDGSMLIDGMVSVDMLKEVLAVKELPDEDEGAYQTLGGFVMAQLGHIPSVAEHFQWNGFRFEVMDMDGRRIDKVLVVPPDASKTESKSST